MDTSIENLKDLKSQCKVFLDSLLEDDEHIESGKQLLLAIRLQGRYLTNATEREQVAQMARDISERLFELTGEYLPSRLEPLDIVDTTVHNVDNTTKPVITWKNQLGIGLLSASIVAVILILAISAFYAVSDGEFVGLISTLTPTASATSTVTLTATYTQTPTPTASATSTPTSTPLPTSTSTVTPSPCTFEPIQPLITGPLANLDAEIITDKLCNEDLTAGKVFEVEGTYAGNLTGLELWILVYSHNPQDKQYYPQAVNPCEAVITIINSGKARWNTNVRLGRKGDSELFDIIITAVQPDSEIGRILTDYLSDVCQNPHREGIPFSELLESPGLLRALDTVTVRTR